MSDIAIRAEGLSKRYRIGQREPYKALRDVLADALYAPFRAVTSTWGGRQQTARENPSDNYIWALKDVSFEIRQGEVVGIIGRNGAGKTTLLKILSRITRPTEGYAEIHGRVGSLLEVGTGFHPELTGRENIYLNGAILGMKKAEIDRKFDEIVAFAEIEKFLDTPVKRYSSGMYVRLAFAVAAHLDPEILLVDEVLAVGDAAFQKKCLGKMGEVAGEGRTVLFVSHNMAAIQGLCSRGILLDSGQVVFEGDVSKAVYEYLAIIREIASLKARWGNDSGAVVRLSRFDIINEQGELSNSVICGSRVIFVMDLEPREKAEHVVISIGIDNFQGVRVCLLANVLVGFPVSLQPPRTTISCEVPQMPLTPGRYFLSLKVTTASGILWLPQFAELEVVGGDFFGSAKLIEATWMGTTLVKHSWAVKRQGL
jgi:lipopolysaccharide transport system ATP-binding protein